VGAGCGDGSRRGAAEGVGNCNHPTGVLQSVWRVVARHKSHHHAIKKWGSHVAGHTGARPHLCPAQLPTMTRFWYEQGCKTQSTACEL
jgi:hypothetical protein